MAVLPSSVPGGKVTQRFGAASSSVASSEPSMYATADVAYWLPIAGGKYYPHFHPGIDEAAAIGTPVVAIEAGTVIVAGWVSKGSGYGVRVQIRPGTVYGGSHFSKVLVKVGQHVTKGQTIALVGTSGVTSGPHTHRFIEITAPNGQRLIYNPALFASGGKFANDPRVQPLASAKLVFLKGPGINIRTSPDLDAGNANLFATSRPTGIFRYPSGAQIHKSWGTGFAYRRELSNDDGGWVEVYGFSRVLFIYRSLVNIQ